MTNLLARRQDCRSRSPFLTSLSEYDETGRLPKNP